MYDCVPRHPIKCNKFNPRSGLSGAHARNRNSTSSGTSSIENKYETIEKSLSPYKIHNNGNGNDRQKVQVRKVFFSDFLKEQHSWELTGCNKLLFYCIQVSIRKQLLLSHPSSPVHNGSDPIADSNSNNPVLSMAGIRSLLSKSPTASSSCASSSHYAQVRAKRTISLIKIVNSKYEISNFRYLR